MTDKPTNKTIEKLLVREVRDVLQAPDTEIFLSEVDGEDITDVINDFRKQAYRLGAEMMSEKLKLEDEKRPYRECSQLQHISRNELRAEQRQISKQVLESLK